MTGAIITIIDPVVLENGNDTVRGVFEVENKTKSDIPLYRTLGRVVKFNSLISIKEFFVELHYFKQVFDFRMILESKEFDLSGRRVEIFVNTRFVMALHMNKLDKDQYEATIHTDTISKFLPQSVINNFDDLMVVKLEFDNEEEGR